LSPANIEGAIKASCPLVGSAVAIGDDRRYVVALLTLDPDAVAAYAAANGIADTSPGALADDPHIRAAIEAGIGDANSRLAAGRADSRSSRSARGSGSRAATRSRRRLKLKRKLIAAKYAEQIEALYSS